MSMLRDTLERQFAENREKEKALGLEKKRMYATERENFLRMHIASDLLEGLIREFAPRVELAGCMEKLVDAYEYVREAMERVYYTIPFEQRRTIQHNADAVTYAVGVKTPGSVGARSGDSRWGMFLSYQDIGILAEASRDHCLTCLGMPHEQAACKLRKTFDIMGVDVEHRDGECGYRQMI